MPPLPPQRRDVEWKLREPQQREADHPEQHSRADRAGGGLAHEAHAPARVQHEDDDLDDRRQDPHARAELSEARRVAQLPTPRSSRARRCAADAATTGSATARGSTPQSPTPPRAPQRGQRARPASGSPGVLRLGGRLERGRRARLLRPGSRADTRRSGDRGTRSSARGSAARRRRACAALPARAAEEADEPGENRGAVEAEAERTADHQRRAPRARSGRRSSSGSAAPARAARDRADTTPGRPVKPGNGFETSMRNA